MISIVKAEFLKIPLSVYAATLFLLFITTIGLVLVQVVRGTPLYFNPLAISFISDYIYVRFCLLIVAAVLISSQFISEFSNRTAGLMVASYGRRGLIFTAKFAVIFFVAAAAPIAAWLILSAIVVPYSAFLAGVNPFTAGGIQWYDAALGSTAQYLRILPIIAMYVAAAIFIGILFKSRIVVFVAMLTLAIMDFTLYSIFSAIVSLTTYINFLPSGWTNGLLGEGARTIPNFTVSNVQAAANFSPQQLFFLSVILALTLIFFLAGLWLFSKRDVAEA